MKHAPWLRLLFVSAVCLVGCAGSLEQARDSTLPRPHFGAPQADPSPHCQGLDRDRANWSAVAAGAAILSGGSGIATLPDTGPESRIALGITATVAAVVGAVALAETHAASEAWARDCAPPPVSAAAVSAVPTQPVSSSGPAAPGAVSSAMSSAAPAPVPAPSSSSLPPKRAP